MGFAETTMLGVRSDLCSQIDRIASDLSRMSGTRLVGEIDAVRRKADDYGMAPVVALARALESALARGERGPMVLSWLDMLRDACGCERLDAAASESFTAALSVRFA